MSKNKKVIIGILIAVLIIVIGVVVAYKLIENSVTNRADFKFKVENSDFNTAETVNHEENVQNDVITETNKQEGSEEYEEIKKANREAKESKTDENLEEKKKYQEELNQVKQELKELVSDK